MPNQRQIARAFHFRDKDIFLGLYKQYIRPRLEFSVQAWAPWCQKDKELLENVQKRAVRMISGLKSEDYEDRLKELGLTSLEERRHRADKALVHSVMHGHSDINVDDWFQKADSPGTRFHRRRERAPGQLCFPLGSGKGCWAGHVGSTAGGVLVTSGGPSATRTV